MERGLSSRGSESGSKKEVCDQENWSEIKCERGARRERGKLAVEVGGKFGPLK